MPTAHKSADSSSISLLDKRRDTALLKKKSRVNRSTNPLHLKKEVQTCCYLGPRTLLSEVPADCDLVPWVIKLPFPRKRKLQINIPILSAALHQIDSTLVEINFILPNHLSSGNIGLLCHWLNMQWNWNSYICLYRIYYVMDAKSLIAILYSLISKRAKDDSLCNVNISNMRFNLFDRAKHTLVYIN
jgi:hypothetical protein